jgi:excisionase family DNA binding protein
VSSTPTNAPAETDSTPRELEQLVWLTPAQAAALLELHPQTIYRAIRTRRLGHNKLSPRGAVRIHRDDLASWLSVGRVEAR